MTPDEIYKELEKLIALLKLGDHEKLARILEHRMYKISWTTATELLENVASILTSYINDHGDTLDEDIVGKTKWILKEIETIVHD